MPIYFGKSADGSDMQEFSGFYVSKCGNWFSNKPFTREQKANDKLIEHCERHNKTIEEVWLAVQSGSKDNLPKCVRDYLIANIDTL
jgi:hypothetical protein